MVRTPLEQWTVHDAAETYGIQSWGQGYFSVNPRGCVAVHPNQDPSQAIDLKELVDQLIRRGLQLPILLRFTDILQHRVNEIHAAFARAIRDNEYQNTYCGVYPIKVNQQRQVVEDLLACSQEHHFGLECGSKPELLVVLALTHASAVPIVCNGFKDDDYIEMVIFAQKLGKNVIPVVEKFNELEMILQHARRLGVRPRFGFRVKPSARGSGRWRFSAGEHSKFGLTISEVLKALSKLKEAGMEDGLILLHYHLGSQITNIHSIKNAITEVARIYVQIAQTDARLEYLDVGGGLGVDYDGSQTNFESSVNYSLQEYANDIVFRVKTICDESGIPHPTLITEAGRATVAYHSVLIFNILGVAKSPAGTVPEEVSEDWPPSLELLHSLQSRITEKNLIESYHDAVQAYDELIHLFNLGHLTLQQRGVSERLYYRCVQAILRLMGQLDQTPEELDGVEDQLSDAYFCNFSVFQSLPDSWAVKQLFPILPIHRLDERPERRGILADITCDSDGKVDRFIDLRDVKRSLELHEFSGQNYYLGAFLVGAYQEILGDLHNLFGDTNSVHVSLGDQGAIHLETVVKGDTVEQTLSYVQYSARELIAMVRKEVERAVREGRLTLDDSARFLRSYETGLGSYTYLTNSPRKPDLEPTVSAGQPEQASAVPK
jgi:arginine decarboxylase